MITLHRACETLTLASARDINLLVSANIETVTASPILYSGLTLSGRRISRTNFFGAVLAFLA